MEQVTVNAATLQSKTVNPSTSAQTITPDSGKYGLSSVTVNKINLQSKTVTPSTSSQTITPDSSYNGLSSVTVNSITNSGIKIVKQLVGTLQGEMHIRSLRIDVSTILSNYKNLTADDFIMELVAIKGFGETNKGSEANSTLTYDPSTGIITCNGIGCCTEDSWNGAGAKVNVYYLYIN